MDEPVFYLIEQTGRGYNVFRIDDPRKPHRCHLWHALSMKEATDAVGYLDHIYRNPEEQNGKTQPASRQ